MKRNWPWIVTCVLVFLVLPLFIAWNMILAPTLETSAAFRELVGKPESEVVKQLGKPQYRILPADAAKRGVDYPWRSQQYLPVPERPIHGPVLLYETRSRGANVPLAVYVFLGPTGQVEGIDFAGTG